MKSLCAGFFSGQRQIGSNLSQADAEAIPDMVADKTAICLLLKGISGLPLPQQSHLHRVFVLSSSCQTRAAAQFYFIGAA